MWVIGHSRSLKVLLFESLGTVSYSASIVSMVVSVAILETLSVANGETYASAVKDTLTSSF